MSIINFSNTRQMEGLLDEISQVKDLIESKINLSRVAEQRKACKPDTQQGDAHLFHSRTKCYRRAARKMTSRTSSFPPLQLALCQVSSQCTICPHYIQPC